MGKASNQKKKRRQGTGASRADLEGQRAWEQLARAAHELNSMFEARKEHLAAVSRSWWRGAEPEAAEVPNWAEGSAGDRFFEDSRMKKYAVAPRLAAAEIPSAEAFAADSGHWDIAVSGPDPCRGPGSGPGYRSLGDEGHPAARPGRRRRSPVRRIGRSRKPAHRRRRGRLPRRRRARLPAGCLLPRRCDVGGRGPGPAPGRPGLSRAAPRRRPRGAGLHAETQRQDAGLASPPCSGLLLPP